ncbi:Proton-dependent oligopeptide transporter family [Corchorus olitorius]|uniref:Proton-dependent oligopeptide transporter family n=1 Tax=Corchorus olitorius TaxID=93759 RepID=A0A1R3I3Q2_9ROSI|nr:Proton-dependent oligopeptide transporter family [Corchorus olitorius]
MDRETQTPSSGDHRKQGGGRGGWITFPFINGTLTGLTLAGFGWMSNLIVYLIQQFNIKSIDAAQVSNIVNGGTSLFPILGAILADSFLGCFSVISIFSCISLLGTGFLALTATLDSLRPEPCNNNGALNSFCKAPSKLQFLVLYGGIALAAMGVGGTRFTLATMGANQFHSPQHQATFFNWNFFTQYTAAVVSSTAIVYIEDNVGWAWGFWICFAANFLALAIFLLGNRFYFHDKPQGSPFLNIARVPVAAFKKRNLILSSMTKDYCHNEPNQPVNYVEADHVPKNSFRFLNRASLKVEGDIGSNGSIARPWSLCTVQQVEDVKTLIRIFPLWSSSILLGTPIAIQASLTVLQALTMDRHVGQHFKIPAGSILVIVFMSTSIFLTLIDRFLCPMWQKLTRKSPSALQRIGVGHALNVLSMAVSALVESRRLKMVHAHKPNMLALWLFPQLVLVGIGEAFHFPGQVGLYYQEFPASLRSTATAMIALIIGISFYLSTAIIDFLRRVTSWLPDNINNGRLDNVYWTLTAVGLLNFGYYLTCARLYKYQNVEKEVDDDTSG